MLKNLCYHTRAYTHMLARTHTHTHTHTHAHTQIHTHAYTHMLARTHTHTHTCPHTDTHTCLHTHACTHIQFARCTCRCVHIDSNHVRPASNMHPLFVSTPPFVAATFSPPPPSLIEQVEATKHRTPHRNADGT